MDATITTTQSQTSKKSVATIIPSLNRKSIQNLPLLTTKNTSPTESINGTNSLSLVNSITSLLSTSDVNSVKNKRKNFNPRCSSVTTVDGQYPITMPSTSPTLTRSSQQNNENEDRPKSTSLASNVIDNTSHHSSDLGLTNHESSTPPSPPPPSTILNQQNFQHQFKDFSSRSAIVEKWRGLLQTQEISLNDDDDDDEDDENDEDDEHDEDDDNSDINHKLLSRSRHYSAMAMTSHFTDSEQNRINKQTKLEFANCNTFNAVQDLLNVYGLQISPLEIVEALRKQLQKFGDCEPPTPPRTPLSISLTTLLNNATAARGSYRNGVGGECGTESVPEINALSEFSVASSTAMTMATTSNANPNSRNNNNGECQFVDMATPISLIKLASISKLMPSNDNRANESYECMISPTNSEMKNKFQEINDDELGSSEDGQSREYSKDHYRNQDQSKHQHNEDYGQKRIQNEKQDQYPDMHDQDDLDNNGDGFEHFGDDDSTNIYNFDGTLNEDSNMSAINDQPMSDDQTSGDELFSGSGSYVGGALDGPSGSGRSLSSSSVNLFDKCSLGLFSPLLQLPQMRNEERQLTAENTRNLSKFSSYVDCKNDQCKVENLREHYHCFDSPCFAKVLSKKEEIIRHLKWHKKRSESLNHGFLRFSSSDDCSATFGKHCTHNRKQTHYHCFQPNCDKIYISTSDVQMHSNYHRKDSAIFQEGFQRYRATEECKADYCLFAGQRTTHFHCRRDNCRFTFKNKADMEKHKSYHVKDKQLARDGFKKFLKNEPCPYTQCRFSRVCNHIHCVRENCYYVLHSSGQLLSHKRKHDRVDGEQAYCRYKMLQKKALTDDSNRCGGVDLSAAALLYSKNLEYSPTPGNFSGQASSMPLVKTNTIKTESDRSSTPKSSITSSAGGSVHSELGAVNKTKTSVSPNWMINNVGSSQAQLSLEFLTQMQQRHKEIMMRDQQSVLTAKGSGNNHCFSGNDDYGNMTAENENLITESVEGFLNSEKSLQELFSMIQQFFTDKCKKQILFPLKGSINKPTLFSSNEPLNLKSSSDHQKPLSFSQGNVEIEIDANVPNDLGCNYIECFINTDEQHLHCLVKDCEAIIPHNLTDIAAHLRMHEINRTAPTDSLLNNSNLMQITSIEGFFNRKRGRPPKNRVVEVYNNVQHSPQAIFTSFKLEKSFNTNTNTQENSHFHTSTQLYNTPSIANQRQQSNNSSSKYSTFEPNKSMKLTNIQTINTHQQHLPTEAKKSTITDSANNAHIQNERHFIMYEPNEKCDNYQQCPQYKNLHFHCTYGGSSNDSSCRFVTKYGRAMDMHLHQFHMEQQPTPVASAAKLIIVDGDCGINGCGFRKIKTHYHCRMCIKGFLSPLELGGQIHRCSISISDFAAVPYNLTTNSDKLSLNQTPSANSSFEQQTTDDEDLQLVVNIPKYSNHCTAGSERTSAGDGTSSVELNAVKSEHSEDERSVSVVRAAGTFYPQNSKTCSGFGSASKNISQQFQLLPTTITNSIEISTKNAQKNPLCQRPFCKLKRKIHGHCDFCNQGFSDLIKLKAHQLKHVSTKLCNYMDLSSSRSDKAQLSLNKKDSNNDAGSDDYSDHPQDLSCNLSQSQIKNLENCDQSFSTSSLHTAQSPKVMEVVDVNNSNNLLLSFNQSAAMPSLLSPMIATHHLPSLHLAHLANYYQQNPYNYHNFYSLLSGVAAAGLGCTTTPKTATGSNLTDLKFDLPPCGTDPSIRQHHLHLINFMNSHQDQQQSKAQSQQQQQQQLEQNHHQQQLKQPQPQQQQQNQPQPQQQQLHSQPQQHHQQQHQLRCKRKETDGFSPLIESLPKQMRPSLSSSVSLSAIADGLPPINVSGSSLSPATSYGLKTVANFKMFKDEPIPQGYLKFRFNEDCNFQNCGYRNHQSHFHCIRNDCYYSFCDKTRFVQHTARHERLDKLMGDDFKQYRANMRCGYDECAYNKNLGGPNNKSSHFHCLKCNFICSDTNKVVAHRRQHSKMEYIRMAGFRKVSNNEKCSTSMTPTTNVSTGCSGGYNDNVATIIPTTTTTGATTTEVAASATSTPTPTSTITTATNITNNECSYCLKQTHYHCLVCDCSVLSRAQLGSHRHRV